MALRESRVLRLAATGKDSSGGLPQLPVAQLEVLVGVPCVHLDDDAPLLACNQLRRQGIQLVRRDDGDGNVRERRLRYSNAAVMPPLQQYNSDEFNTR